MGRQRQSITKEIKTRYNNASSTSSPSANFLFSRTGSINW